MKEKGSTSSYKNQNQQSNISQFIFIFINQTFNLYRPSFLSDVCCSCINCPTTHCPLLFFFLYFGWLSFRACINPRSGSSTYRDSPQVLKALLGHAWRSACTMGLSYSISFLIIHLPLVRLRFLNWVCSIGGVGSSSASPTQALAPHVSGSLYGWVWS